MNRYKFDEERHCHTLDGRPLFGTSTVVNIIGKGGALAWWASRLCAEQFGYLDPKKNEKAQVLHAAAEGHKRVSSMGLPEYQKFLVDAYKAHSKTLKSTAQEGTDTHALVEEYVKGRIANDPELYDAAIQPFVDWAKEHVERFVFSECHCYSEELWTGGISDFGFIDRAGDFCIGDVKRSGPYYSQFVQIAGYDIALTENGGYTPDGEKILDPPAAAKHYIVFPLKDGKSNPLMLHNTEDYRSMFKAALALYKGQQQYEEEGKK